MRTLFDTHILIWALRDQHRLSHLVSRLLEANVPDRHFSVLAVWEVAIKNGRGRPNFVLHPGEFRDRLLEAGMQEMPITAEHALAVRNLPQIHRDPFDRIMVAQAICEGLTLVTADKALAGYPARVMVM